MANEVLIVDDEADIRMLISGILEDEGYKTREAADGESALESIRLREPGLVILDIWLQGSALDGMDLLKIIRTELPALPVVMISGHGTIETAVKAIHLGAYDFIEKPFKSDRLLLVVERAMEAARLRRELEDLRQRTGAHTELIGNTQAINQLRQAIQRVAPTGSRILITGPAGSGKEVVARQLHAESCKATGPFVVLNCATMRPERLEIELFGAEAAAEGPESPRKIGTLERAHGGTLLLDEVADMPLETQGKIVRVLQEQSFVRVGGTRTVDIDVRVIASTNRDLEAMIRESRFRQDLYYRLCVVPLSVPALKERREDIALLAEFFMDRQAASAGLPKRTIGMDAMAALQSYDWPGNIRQLRNVIESLLIMAPGEPSEPIRAEMLPPDISSSAPIALLSNGNEELMRLPLREAREAFERQYLEAQVSRFGGNISRTASFVGMERSALHRKLRLLGISPADR
jgi:two-component system nitrogen regulation response regulator NtrX